MVGLLLLLLLFRGFAVGVLGKGSQRAKKNKKYKGRRTEISIYRGNPSFSQSQRQPSYYMQGKTRLGYIARREMREKGESKRYTKLMVILLLV